MSGVCVAEMTPVERMMMFAEDLVAMLRACVAEERPIDDAIVATAQKLRVSLCELGADDVIAETAKRVVEKQAKRMRSLEADKLALEERIANAHERAGELLDAQSRERERHDGELVEAELRGEKRSDERFARAAGTDEALRAFVEANRLRHAANREGRFGKARTEWVSITIKAGRLFETLDFADLQAAAKRLGEIARERGGSAHA